MAGVTLTGAKPTPSAGAPGDAVVATWNLTTADPNGDPVVGYEDYPDRTFQCYGAAFGGATVQLQGRLDTTAQYDPINDPQGNPISKTAAAGSLEAALEAVPITRAALSVVGAGATITAVLYMRKK